jgi:hypothetical protein
MGRPVKSMGRACGLESASSYCSGPVRTTRLANDPAAHVTVYHKRESAEHALLFQRMGSVQKGADSLY